MWIYCHALPSSVLLLWLSGLLHTWPWRGAVVNIFNAGAGSAVPIAAAPRRRRSRSPRSTSVDVVLRRSRPRLMPRAVADEGINQPPPPRAHPPRPPSPPARPLPSPPPPPAARDGDDEGADWTWQSAWQDDERGAGWWSSDHSWSSGNWRNRNAWLFPDIPHQQEADWESRGDWQHSGRWYAGRWRSRPVAAKALPKAAAVPKRQAAPLVPAQPPPPPPAAGDGLPLAAAPDDVCVGLDCTELVSEVQLIATEMSDAELEIGAISEADGVEAFETLNAHTRLLFDRMSRQLVREGTALSLAAVQERATQYWMFTDQAAAEVLAVLTENNEEHLAALSSRAAALVRSAAIRIRRRAAADSVQGGVAAEPLDVGEIAHEIAVAGYS